MEEEIVPLFPASTNYPTTSNGDRRSNRILNTRRQRNQHINSNSNGALTGDVEKAEMTFNGGVATSLRCEDGVYRRLYQHTSDIQESITHSDDDDGEEWTNSRRGIPLRNSSCRWFLFCIIVIFFLFLLYVPAYNNVAFRPDASTLHDRVHYDSYHREMSKRLMRKSKGGTVVGWSYNKSRNMRTYVLPDNVTVLNQPKSICKLKHQSPHQRHSTPGPPDKEPDIFLLVIITSSMAHYNRRMAIRETWGNHSNYEFLAKRLQNITDHFANVNMTESLFSELGYSSNNDSLEDKNERIRRDVTDEDVFVLNEESEFVPMLDEGNQITNVDDRSDIEESRHNSSNEKYNIVRLIKDNGANSYRRKQALLESLTDETSKQNIYSSYKQLDRLVSNHINYKKHNLSAPYRHKRDTSPDNHIAEEESEKTQAGEDGEKRAIYDEVEEDVLGNFETTDAEPVETPEDYDYQTEESNVMRIPRRGEANIDYANVKKALQDIKNILEVSMKDNKLSLKYVSDKNTDEDSRKMNKHSEGNVEDHDRFIHPDIPKGNKDQGFVKTKYLFLLGQSANDNDTDLQTRIDEEAALYGDIIQEGFIDSYNNLTLKSVMLLKWVLTNCEEDVHYIMKTDDDMFINIPRLIEALKNKTEEYVRSVPSPSAGLYSDEKLLMGDLICQARPISDMRSKWYSPTYMYSGKVYPRYLSGVGYVMSMGAARALYEAALDTPLFHLEDIFITGMCSRKAGIKPRDHNGFSYGGRKFSLCVYAYLITAHRVTPSQMRQMYGMLTSNNTHHLEACEAKRLVNVSSKTSSSSNKSVGRNFLGSPRNILTGLAGFGYADARNKKLRKANNGCS